jgi:hypothetical protein
VDELIQRVAHRWRKPTVQEVRIRLFLASVAQKAMRHWSAASGSRGAISADKMLILLKISHYMLQGIPDGETALSNGHFSAKIPGRKFVVHRHAAGYKNFVSEDDGVAALIYTRKVLGGDPQKEFEATEADMLGAEKSNDAGFSTTVSKIALQTPNRSQAVHVGRSSLGYPMLLLLTLDNRSKEARIHILRIAVTRKLTDEEFRGMVESIAVSIHF